MNIADQADLRQWTQPAASSFQVAKLRLKPGTYKVRAVGLKLGGAPTGEVSEWWDVKVERPQKNFLNWRSVRK